MVTRTRKSTRSAVELASDIGAKAFDLHCYGDAVARGALREIAKVNPEMLAWLRDRLLDITRQPACAQCGQSVDSEIHYVGTVDSHRFQP